MRSGLTDGGLAGHLGGMHVVRWILRLVISLVVAGAVFWAVGALKFDFPWPAFRVPAAAGFAVVVAAGVWMVCGFWRKAGFAAVAFCGVLAWWFAQRPSNERRWQPEVARMAWAEVDGDRVTIHNLRNFEYRTEADFAERWETRTVRLSQLTGIDLAINYWGSPWMAHPIASFQFADSPPVCFSIETRKEVGESYSAIGGIYRQFELIYIAATEEDVLRVRTNFRKGEDVYLYRLNISRERARGRFLEYIASLNELRERPRWYNAVTTNCTTSIRTQHAASKRTPWDWRILLNGKADEMLFEQNAFVSDGLTFPVLKERAHINERAKNVEAPINYSREIRVSVPGMH